ncbi:MAG: hypothetical protein HN763_05400 [Opitutales bacterium]|jgi:hypothetical protein|nr:hypothetical protein [Opitutales bacterium]MBT5816262.1 hypothetical protein [Opitutales bacterium]MBT6379828.1 hypothetical protein [Opitutales bacterium]MBT7865782.1 hypothetical protein [Opitutales bacterium]
MMFKQSKTSLALACLCGIILLPSSTVAHHGVTGQFDLEQVLTVSGVVNRVRFVNPHSYVYFKVKNDAGEEEQWRCELRSGSLLKRKGWTEKMFEIGTQITVFGSPDRRDPKTCYTETITFEDGRVVARYDTLDTTGNIVVGEREFVREDGAPNLAGNWTEPIKNAPNPWGPSPRSEGPPVGNDFSRDGSPQKVAAPQPVGWGNEPGTQTRPPPYVLTDLAREEADDFTADQNPRFQCEPTNIIFDYAFDQMMNKIEQTGSAIVITYGFMDMVRVIHLVGGYPDEIEPSVTGYSVGDWEGDTLVVHTKGFKPGFLRAIGGRATESVRHSDQMEITERFTMSKDGTELTREYTIVDPHYLAEPYSHSNSSLYSTSKFFPYECEELKDDSQQ